MLEWVTVGSHEFLSTKDSKVYSKVWRLCWGLSALKLGLGTQSMTYIKVFDSHSLRSSAATMKNYQHPLHERTTISNSPCFFVLYICLSCFPLGMCVRFSLSFSLFLYTLLTSSRFCSPLVLTDEISKSKIEYKDFLSMHLPSCQHFPFDSTKTWLQSKKRN